MYGMSRLLVAAAGLDIDAHLEIALTYGLGLELQAFSLPQVLNGDWRDVLDGYKRLLADFPGPLASHGAFFDMSVASEDPDIVALTRARYLQNLDIAAELGAEHVVFHTNFLPMIRTEVYRRRYIERQIGFLNQFGHEAARRDLWIVLENMWDPDPFILQSIFKEVDAPNVGICLDISHIYLYNNAHPLEQWTEVLAPYIIHSHINNTRGVIDEHLAINTPGGAIDFSRVLPRLAGLPRAPWLVLELDDPPTLLKSVRFAQRVLHLTPPKRRPD
jgi:sugar phosphate isomerase/epimerase